MCCMCRFSLTTMVISEDEEKEEEEEELTEHIVDNELKLNVFYFLLNTGILMLLNLLQKTDPSPQAPALRSHKPSAPVDLTASDS